MADNKVSSRRWLGWLGSADFHMPTWHSRLLAICAMGQQLGVYKPWHDFPLWKAQSEWARARATDRVVGEDDPDLQRCSGDGSNGDDDEADQPNPRAGRDDVGNNNVFSS